MGKHRTFAPRRMSGYRRAAAVVAVVAVILAGATVTTFDQPLPGLSALPGATAEPAPTGPTGPGGPGSPGSGSGGSQFQPPGLPEGGPGYSGGNYPAPPQGNGIDINNPSTAAEYSQAPQYPQQQNDPSRQPPVHGTQPPNYDQPGQQQPSKPQQPTLQPTQQSAQPTQEPSPQQDSQNLNQKQQQCQAAATQLAAGFLPTGITGGGGRSPVLGPWKLDPAAPSPSPPCPAGCPGTAQPQAPASSQPLATLTPEQIEQIGKDAYNQGREDASKCDGFTKFQNIFGLVGSSIGVVASVVGAPFSGGQSLWGLIPSFGGIFATWDNLRKC